MYTYAIFVDKEFVELVHFKTLREAATYACRAYSVLEHDVEIYQKLVSWDKPRQLVRHPEARYY